MSRTISSTPVQLWHLTLKWRSGFESSLVGLKNGLAGSHHRSSWSARVWMKVPVASFYGAVEASTTFVKSASRQLSATQDLPGPCSQPHVRDTSQEHKTKNEEPGSKETNMSSSFRAGELNPELPGIEWFPMKIGDVDHHTSA